MVGGEAMIVAGVGCSSGFLTQDVVALVRRVQREAGCAAGALAVPAFKNGEAGLQEAAKCLELPLIFVDRVALEEVQHLCETRSAIAEVALGLASVAEACALVVAGPESRLLVARISLGKVTCALAGGAL
jgi:cobalt-precorrin 5A hydrolase